MKLQISSWVFALVLSLALIGISSPTFAYYHPSYNFDNEVLNYSNPRWMADIDDNVRLSLLTIPGTNASASRGKGGDTYQTQIMTIPSQLDAGIRYFDFGVFKEKTHDMSLYLYCSWIYLDHDLSYPLTKFKEFLENNPSETIIMRVSQEHSTHSDAVIFDCLEQYIKQFSSSIWHGDNFSEMNFNPPLGEIRGKIVIFYPYFKKYQQLHTFSDLYDMQPPTYFYSNWDLYDKWVSSQHFIQSTRFKDEIQYRTCSILYLAAGGWTLPCFVASGHGHCANDGYQLSTGRATPFFNSYPDFPRTDCFFGMCTIAFKGLNMLWTDKIINETGLNSLGIIAANFPGAGFIDTMIALNRFFAKPQHITGMYFKIVTILEPKYAIDYDIENSIAVIWKSENQRNQQWKFMPVHNSPYYRISSVHDDTKSLTVSDVDSDFTKVVIQQDENNDAVSQLWTLERHENGYFSLKSARGLYLHCSGFELQNGLSLYVGKFIGEEFIVSDFDIHPTIV